MKKWGGLSRPSRPASDGPVSKYARTYLGYYVLLVYMPSQSARHAKWVEKKTRVLVQTKMHEYSSWKNTRARANQNARVQFVETKDTRVLFVQTMMHTAAD